MDMQQSKSELKNDGKFLVWVNERYYFQIDLQPKQFPDVTKENVNVCTLVDSETCQALETIAFPSDSFMPIFINKDMKGFKQIGMTFKKIVQKHNLKIVKTSKMPKDKVRKSVKKIAKRKILK